MNFEERKCGKRCTNHEPTGRKRSRGSHTVEAIGAVVEPVSAEEELRRQLGCGESYTREVYRDRALRLAALVKPKVHSHIHEGIPKLVTGVVAVGLVLGVASIAPVDAWSTMISDTAVEAAYGTSEVSMEEPGRPIVKHTMFEGSPAKVLDVPVSESLSILVEVDDTPYFGVLEPASVEQTPESVEKTPESVMENNHSTEEEVVGVDLSIGNMVATVESIESEKEAQAVHEDNSRAKVGTVVESTGYLVETSQTDEGYQGRVVTLSSDDRYVLEHLVMGEAGTQGFEGAALVAQCIRDAIVYDGYKSVESVRRGLGYEGKLSTEPNQDVKDAVSYIFDQGQSAVQHRILYFYSHHGGWHETQNFIVEYKAHRFFDRWTA